MKANYVLAIIFALAGLSIFLIMREWDHPVIPAIIGSGLVFIGMMIAVITYGNRKQ